jgi:hypothetical protein
MFHGIVFGVSALVFAGLIGCAPAAQNPASGVVHGSVVTGPACPGPAQLGRKDCAPRPLQTTVRVFASTAQRGGAVDDKPVTTVATDRDGRFQLTLAPGTYQLMAVPPGGIATVKPQYIAVTAGSTITVELVVDTGMR